MCYAFPVDNKAIFLPGAIKLRKGESILDAILQLQTKFTDPMQSLLSYKRPFALYCDVRFVDVRIKNIVKYMPSSMFLAASFRATSMRYIRAGKMMISHQGVLPLLLKLNNDALAEIMLGITHL